jgi:hypothetical protein
VSLEDRVKVDLRPPLIYMIAMKRLAPSILGAVILALGFGFAGGGTAYAQSGSGDQFCDGTSCLNAWNGGPYVNAYTQGVIANNYFSIYYASGWLGIQFTGNSNSPYDYECISDYGNSSTDARAGLNGDCAAGSIAWGAKFTAYSCDSGQGTAFKNQHWNGWLAPSHSGNGAPFYLNSSTEACFHVH